MENLEGIIQSSRFLIFAAAVLIFALRKLFLMRAEREELLSACRRALLSALICSGASIYGKLDSMKKTKDCGDCCKISVRDFILENSLSQFAGGLTEKPQCEAIELVGRYDTEDGKRAISSVALCAGLGIKPVELFSRTDW